MDLEGNIKHWRSICWERGTQHIKLTMLFAELPCLCPLLPVDNNCLLQSPVQEKTCCSRADFGIFKCLMFVPKVAKWALPNAHLNSDRRAAEASKRESEVWEQQSVHGRSTMQQQRCRGVLGGGGVACRELRQEGLSAACFLQGWAQICLQGCRRDMQYKIYALSWPKKARHSLII